MTTVVASGYFNPLHEGHLDYLEMSKSLGDRLIVIVNSDDQAILKHGHSFIDENTRKRIVESLRFVDWAMIAIDKDLSVCESLEAIKPDIFAKGGDRHKGEIPEAPICERLGIKIIDGLGDKIQSSSELIRKIRNEKSNKG